MGIFSRFRDIIHANINSMLERAEDPHKMIRLMIQEMEDTLIEIKSACAGVMAEAKIIQREFQDLKKQVDAWEQKARLAIEKGRDDLARQALNRKHRYLHRLDSAGKELGEHSALQEQYQDDIRQLEDKLKTAREKERLLVQRQLHAVSKKRAQKEIRQLEYSDAIMKFEEFENRIERMEAEAELVNLGSRPSLADELERIGFDEEIERELQALKSSPVEKIEERIEALETIVNDDDPQGV